MVPQIQRCVIKLLPTRQNKYITVNDQQNASRSQWILLIYSKFTATHFGKQLPSSGGHRCLRSYSSSVCIVGVYGLRSVQCGPPARTHGPPPAETCWGKLKYINKSTSSLTHLLVILQRYYKMLGPTIKISVLRLTRIIKSL
jgi:hypothetical protein